MTYIEEKLRELESQGVVMNTLAKESCVPAFMLYRVRDGKRPCSVINAMKLEVATNGFIKAEKANPQCSIIFDLVKNINRSSMSKTPSQDSTQANPEQNLNQVEGEAA